MFELPDCTEWDCIPYNDLGPGNNQHARAGGVEVGKDARDFLLVLHPWGADNIQLFEVTEGTAPPLRRPHAEEESLIECANCKEEFLEHELAQKCCVFHPGQLSGEKDVSDCSDSTGARSDSVDYEGFEWLCCSTLFGSWGCAVERQHLQYSEVAPDYDEQGGSRQESWNLQESDSGSEG
ncbi:hypothetical protein BST61_g9865 [Cercospora zeina]